MEKVTYYNHELADGSIVEYALINHGNDQFTSMTKAHYDSLKEAEQLNGSVDGETL